VEWDGDGTPLVCVHGMAGSHANWSALASHLSRAGRRVLALDLPGHGLTRPGGRDCTYAGHAGVLRRFVEEVAGGRAVLVGNSLGGLLCVDQAATHPASVEALALVGPAIPVGRSRLHPITALGFAGYAVPGVGELIVSTRRRHFSPETLVAQALWMCCGHPDRVPPEVVREHVEVLRARAGFRGLDDAFLATARTMLRRLARPGRLRAALDSISCPVLMLHGDRDRLVPVGAARRLAASSPAWEFHELEGVGHVPQLEAAERTANALLDWLSRVEGATATERRRPADIIRA
jgi:pimeloyl-ACP methyl ester carboxylesterase